VRIRLRRRVRAHWARNQHGYADDFPAARSSFHGGEPGRLPSRKCALCARPFHRKKLGERLDALELTTLRKASRASCSVRTLTLSSVRNLKTVRKMGGLRRVHRSLLDILSIARSQPWLRPDTQKRTVSSAQIQDLRLAIVSPSSNSSRFLRSATIRAGSRATEASAALGPKRPSRGRRPAIFANVVEHVLSSPRRSPFQRPSAGLKPG
jgi:hypothetical protein